MDAGARAGQGRAQEQLPGLRSLQPPPLSSPWGPEQPSQALLQGPLSPADLTGAREEQVAHTGPRPWRPTHLAHRLWDPKPAAASGQAHGRLQAHLVAHGDVQGLGATVVALQGLGQGRRGHGAVGWRTDDLSWAAGRALGEGVPAALLGAFLLLVLGTGHGGASPGRAPSALRSGGVSGGKVGRGG